MNFLVLIEIAGFPRACHICIWLLPQIFQKGGFFHVSYNEFSASGRRILQ